MALATPFGCSCRHKGLMTGGAGLLGIVMLASGCQRDGQTPESASLPAPTVKVIRVAPLDLPLYREFVGQIRGREDVEVRARVQGYLQSIDFQQGGNVKAGDLLFTLDKRPYEAALAQAKASEAQLRSEYEQLQADAKRYAELSKTGIIPKQQAEQTASKARASAAAVDAQHAVVKAREVDLTYTQIRAPIAGRISLTPYSVGDLVGTASGTEKPLATVSAIDTVKVRFGVSETDYLRYIKNNPQAGAQAIPLDLKLADGSVYPHTGRVLTADSTIDPASATLMIEAEFPNPQSLLRTGQYAKVRVRERTLSGAIAIPPRAVRDQQGISSVLVVGADDKVEPRRIEIGDRGGDLWAVTAGLQAGDRVIVEGATRAPGTTVKPEEVPVGGYVTANK